MKMHAEVGDQIIIHHRDGQLLYTVQLTLHKLTQVQLNYLLSSIRTTQLSLEIAKQDG